MSKVSKFCLTSLIGFTLIPLANIAYAAEHGQYRPGHPYHSLPLNSAENCETQCQSDRACRGWNFVKINPQQATGICEFNAQSVAPVQSPISISGNGAVNSSSARLVSAGTRTIRVGAPVPKQTDTVKTQAQTRLRHTLQNQPQYSLQGRVAPQIPRRVVHAPLPRHFAPSAAHYSDHNSFSNKSLTAQQTRQRQGEPSQGKLSSKSSLHRTLTPRLTHTLDMAQPVSNSQHGQLAASTRPQLEHALDGRHIQQQEIIQKSRLQTRQQVPQQKHISPYPPHSMPSPVHKKPKHMQNIPKQAHNKNTVQALANPYPQPKNFQAVQSSLFGSLYDDVKQPKSLSPSDVIDPNAPIATVQSVPVHRPKYSNLSQLAGQ